MFKKIFAITIICLMFASTASAAGFGTDGKFGEQYLGHDITKVNRDILGLTSSWDYATEPEASKVWGKYLVVANRPANWYEAGVFGGTSDKSVWLTVYDMENGTKLESWDLHTAKVANKENIVGIEITDDNIYMIVHKYDFNAFGLVICNNPLKNYTTGAVPALSRIDTDDTLLAQDSVFSEGHWGPWWVKYQGYKQPLEGEYAWWESNNFFAIDNAPTYAHVKGGLEVKKAGDFLYVGFKNANTADWLSTNIDNKWYKYKHPLTNFVAIDVSDPSKLDGLCQMPGSGSSKIPPRQFGYATYIYSEPDAEYVASDAPEGYTNYGDSIKILRNNFALDSIQKIDGKNIVGISSIAFDTEYAYAVIEAITDTYVYSDGSGGIQAQAALHWELLVGKPRYLYAAAIKLNASTSTEEYNTLDIKAFKLLPGMAMPSGAGGTKTSIVKSGNTLYITENGVIRKDEDEAIPYKAYTVEILTAGALGDPVDFDVKGISKTVQPALKSLRPLKDDLLLGAYEGAAGFEILDMGYLPPTQSSVIKGGDIDIAFASEAQGNFFVYGNKLFFPYSARWGTVREKGTPGAYVEYNTELDYFMGQPSSWDDEEEAPEAEKTLYCYGGLGIMNLEPGPTIVVESGETTYDVTVSYEGTETAGTLILAVYGTNNKLMKVVTEKNFDISGETATHSFAKVDGALKVKVLLWDEDNKKLPLIDGFGILN